MTKKIFDGKVYEEVDLETLSKEELIDIIKSESSYDTRVAGPSGSEVFCTQQT